MVKKWFWGVQNTYSKNGQKMVVGTMGPGPRPWPKAQFPGPALAPCALGQGLGSGPIIPATIFLVLFEYVFWGPLGMPQTMFFTIFLQSDFGPHETIILVFSMAHAPRGH